MTGVRVGQVTRYFYDPLRRLAAMRDPLGRTVTQEWCGCGSLEAVIDPNANRTRCACLAVARE